MHTTRKHLHTVKAVVNTSALRFLLLFILTILLIQILSVVILLNLSKTISRGSSLKAPRPLFQDQNSTIP